MKGEDLGFSDDMTSEMVHDQLRLLFPDIFRYLDLHCSAQRKWFVCDPGKNKTLRVAIADRYPNAKDLAPMAKRQLVDTSGRSLFLGT